jgi:hypothetical protein
MASEAFLRDARGQDAQRRHAESLRDHTTTHTRLASSLTMIARFCFFFLGLSLGLTYAFVQSRCATADGRIRIQHDTSLRISFGSSKNDSGSTDFPRDVKEAISKCRAAVQEALGQRLSRMDVEFPVGTRFGIEKGRKRAKTSDEDGTPTREALQASDRELARLFVEMFQPLGGEHIATVFVDEGLADQARKNWKGDASASCRILSTGKRNKASGGKKQKKPMGFAAKLAAEFDEGVGGPFQLPDGIEVALFVAPGPKELLIVEKICSQVGMGTLVILLNARLSKVTNFGSDAAEKLFLEQFEPVFQLGAAPQDVAPGILIHRSYPGDWLIARRLKVGKPKLLHTQKERPTAEECRTTHESIEASDVEKGVEGILGNVAGWFN